MVNKERFEKAFDEWFSKTTEFQVAFDEQEQNLIRSIAGLFYFAGASDAIQDARAILASAEGA